MKIIARNVSWLAALYLVLMSTLAAADPHGIELEALDGLLKNERDQIVFIDVRDPVEIMFTGFTDAVDRNIPFQLVDRTRWNDNKGVFAMELNTNFAQQVAQLVKEKGLSNDAKIITMCRSGSARGKPSAEHLRENGFPEARYLIHGFQGSSNKQGDHKGLRVKNGWQNSGMPWQKKPNPQKIYRN